MRLLWHRYNYYPYEKELALREARVLLGPRSIREDGDAVVLERPATTTDAKRLVYFSAAAVKGRREPIPTKQSELERVNGNGVGRQSTRYSAHGLHEYKGKFNPQVAKAMLNIFGARPGNRAFDPFCGSGTSLVECAHLKISALGTDINPMAVFIANAKLRSLAIPAKELTRAASKAIEEARKDRGIANMEDGRGQYLSQWFTWPLHCEIEHLRSAIGHCKADVAPVLLSVASNLLREYSLQDPNDLRIRRRKSPLPSLGFLEAFERAATSYCGRLGEAQNAIGVREPSAMAMEADARSLGATVGRRKFDLALTSPPYATALPYIDTQRLSLVWLGLIPPEAIAPLEARLVGSREVRGESKARLLSAVQENESNLPDQEANLCQELQHALAPADGFRRQGVPRLLYRYFRDMSATFAAVLPHMKAGAPFGLIVGGNHTVLGGRRFDIDTPRHLTSLAQNAGWRHVETIPLQTYQRFGLHSVNATTAEALVILSA